MYKNKITELMLNKTVGTCKNMTSMNKKKMYKNYTWRLSFSLFVLYSDNIALKLEKNIFYDNYNLV